MIRLTEVTKVFNQGRHNEHHAVKGVTLGIEDGRVTVLKGPSGSGKTTLLTLIGCLARPTSGRVHHGGRDISGLPERFLTEIRRRTFGFVFQRFNLIHGVSVLENVMLPAYPLGDDHGALRERALTLLERLGLDGKGEAKAEWLSGGEAQRVAIARALINDPQVIIADEPTANLDTALSRAFLTIIGELKAEGRTVILTSHDPLVCEADVVDRVVAMRDGRLTERELVEA
ncbi:MAG TPA: ABC transporter ATP-binding protein [Azospirillum sp.]|nr:ABC transporter ATP-binding protein [Azospirillum sp.]